jgi:hypothetical protein
MSARETPNFGSVSIASSPLPPEFDSLDEICKRAAHSFHAPSPILIH